MHYLKRIILAAQIEFNWKLIRKEREKGKKLLAEGNSLSSEKMVSLNKHYSKHCAAATRAQQKYYSLCGNERNSPLGDIHRAV